MAPTDARSEGQKPFVSIGLPVYNGGDYLEEALESIAAQTYRNYEVVISDNASTDRTADICESYAARDPRIRYVRNPVNIGGDRNYCAADRSGSPSCGARPRSARDRSPSPPMARATLKASASKRSSR